MFILLALVGPPGTAWNSWKRKEEVTPVSAAAELMTSILAVSQQSPPHHISNGVAFTARDVYELDRSSTDNWQTGRLSLGHIAQDTTTSPGSGSPIWYTAEDAPQHFLHTLSTS